MRLPRLACDTTYHYRISATDEAGNVATSGDRTFTTRACPDSGGPEIDVWYGHDQTFPRAGRPIRWINILGDVSDPDGVAYVGYSLNGATVHPIDRANPRIAGDGDFNLELDPDALQIGANTVELIARDPAGHESRTTVTVNVAAGQHLPQTYRADWASAQSIADFAQVSDGLWKLDGSSVRTVEPGYDRLIALGDMGWSNYEVTAPITIHSLSATSPHAGVGLITGWQGHEGNDRPRTDWPLGGLCFYFRAAALAHYELLMMQFGSPPTVDSDGNMNGLQVGTTYMWKFRAQSVPSDPASARYSCKVWRQGTPEPATWGADAELPARPGSVALVADFADASFGVVDVRPLAP